MDENDVRRSRVPAGTFGGSEPPSASAASDTAAQQQAAADRRRFTSTLTGRDELAPEDLEEIEAAAAELPAPRNRTGTLVGHPSVPPPPPPNAVLSPPKWRGAKPYLEGEEPQPQVTSIASPPSSGAADRPEGVVIGALRSRVTTKVGQPPPAPAAPPIDDTIQRMLENQASVPIQVDEPLDVAAIPEVPLDQLPIVELPDSTPNVSPAVVAAARARAAELASARSEPASDSQPRSDQAVDEPDAPAATDRGRRPERSRRDADRTPAERAAASSVAPAEVTRLPRRDDSRPGLGALAVATFAVVFAGGWWLTRGGFPRPQPAPAVVAPAAATATQPAAPADPVPPPAPAVPPSTQPAAPAAQPASAQREASERDAAARRARSGSKPVQSGAQTAAEPALEDGARARPRGSETPAAAETPAMTIKPRVDPANLPDIPSREDVIAALEPLRPSINECVHGTHGVAQLDITVTSSGSVSHAVVGGDFAGTPEGSCIARATRNAQFTPFAKPRFRVIYPFSL